MSSDQGVTKIFRRLAAAFLTPGIGLAALCGIAILAARIGRFGTTIVFEAEPPIHANAVRDFNLDIFAQDLATYLSVNLTRDPESQDTSAAVSPDGEKIAYFSTHDGARHLYMLTIGGNPKRLSATPVRFGFRPEWSPDSREIVYEVDAGAQADLYIVDIDRPIEAGTNPRVLADDIFDDRFPAWSPTGEWITFVSWRDGNADIFIVRPDGRGVRNLTQDKGWDVSPSWSPDGAEIAFFSVRSRYRNLYVMDAEGSHLRQLTDMQELSAGYYWYAPAWSPAGDIIAMQTTINRDREIILVTRDGGSPIRLTAEDGTDAIPVWASDGSRLIFMSDRSGEFALYEMDWRESLTRRLTPVGMRSAYPALWSGR